MGKKSPETVPRGLLTLKTTYDIAVYITVILQTYYVSVDGKLLCEVSIHLICMLLRPPHPTILASRWEIRLAQALSHDHASQGRIFVQDWRKGYCKGPSCNQYIKTPLLPLSNIYQKGFIVNGLM